MEFESKEAYFLISPEHNLKQIGYYPQTRIRKGYNPNLDGHWTVPHNDFPDFEPNLELELNSKGKRTDYMDFNDLRNGFLVSKKLKDILLKYELPKHKFYPVKIYHEEELLTYYWFYYIIDDFWESLDNDNSYAEIINADNIGEIEGKVPIISKEQVFKEEDNFTFPYRLRTGKITLKKGTPKYDFYQIKCLGLQKIFSKALINNLKEENITGFEFRQVDFFEIKI